jgi:asparagine synthase (glutamine-hydrolysing)
MSPALSLKQGKRYMLAYVGVMGIQDGVEYALHALHKLVHTYNRQDILLVLMGDGDQLSTLKMLAHTLDLDAYTHFTGWVTMQDMLHYLTVTDIGISPDPSNELNDRSTMLKTMEYMAMGLPVVAFDLPETRHTAQQCALYATPNQVDDFAQHINTLLDDEELRCNLGLLARKRVEEELSWEHSREKLWQAYARRSALPSTNSDAHPIKENVVVIS